MNPISSFLKSQLGYILLILLGAGAGAYWAWDYQSNKYEKELSDLRLSQAREIGVIRQAGVSAMLAEKARYEQLSSVLHDASRQQYEVYEREQKLNAKLTADLGSAKHRVSIAVASCNSSSGSGTGSTATPGRVVYGTARAELDPQAASDLNTIASDGDNAIRKLSACQSYVNKVQDSFKKKKT